MATSSSSPMALLRVFLFAIFATMTFAVKFTPEAMLSVNRRGPASPNPAGTLALYTNSKYDFTKHKNAVSLNVMDLKTGKSTLFSNSSAVGEANWLGDGNKIVWLQYEDDGSTSFNIGDASKPDATPFVAGSVPGEVENVKLADLGGGKVGIVFTGQTSPDGTLYNATAAEEPLSSGRAYTRLFVRHWDTYLTPQRNQIWYAVLTPATTAYAPFKYTMSKAVNALKGTGLESPIPPFGSTDNFDVSAKGIAFVAKDPKLQFGKYNQATTTKSDLYYISLKTFSESPAPKAKVVLTPGLEGATTAPTFSNGGTKIAFLRQKDISYESDLWRIFLTDVSTLSVTEFYGKKPWDRWAAGMIWSADDKSLYIWAEEFGHEKLFVMPSSPSAATSLPKQIFASGSVSDVQLLPNNKLFVSSAKYIDNSVYSFVDPVVSAASNATKGVTTFSANLGNTTPNNYGLSQSQVSETWYTGANGVVQHAFVIKPSFFKEGEKYPLAYILHGGPQGSFPDGWSNRWNLALYAEQGYVVVTPHFTGSTGFGQKLIDSIQNQWGGLPYTDIENCFEHIKTNLPYVDTSRSVALGASYGGYMMYWLAGHALGLKMKAIFAHDGSFNTLSQYSSEELWFMNHDFNGTLWENWDNYARWNPAQHTANWKTPMLIVHNEKDYRLPIAEGLAAFNVLQSKGIESKFLSFPDENHWVLNRENSLVWHKSVLDFLNPKVGLPRYSKDDDEAYRATLMNGPWI